MSDPINAADIEFRYIQNIMHRPGYRFDRVDAYIDGEKVAYLEFDYANKQTMADLPHIWAFACEWRGIGNKDVLQKPYRDMSGEEALAALNTICTYSGEMPEPGRANDLIRQVQRHGRNAITSVSDEERDDIIRALRNMETGSYAKKLKLDQKRMIEHACKPFVAYANAGINKSKGLIRDNSGRGIGTALYRAATRWIAERGLAKGLYSSSLQSESAQAIWAAFERRGWVTHDGSRRYLDPKKMG